MHRTFDSQKLKINSSDKISQHWLIAIHLKNSMTRLFSTISIYIIHKKSCTVFIQSLLILFKIRNCLLFCFMYLYYITIRTNLRSHSLIKFYIVGNNTFGTFLLFLLYLNLVKKLKNHNYFWLQNTHFTTISSITKIFEIKWCTSCLKFTLEMWQ